MERTLRQGRVGGRKMFITRAASKVHSRRNEWGGELIVERITRRAKKRFSRFGTVPIGYDRRKSGRPDHVNLLFVSRLGTFSEIRTRYPYRSLHSFPRFLPILTSIFGGKSWQVDRYRCRIKTATVSRGHFYSNESIGFLRLRRSIDRSITRQSV